MARQIARYTNHYGFILQSDTGEYVKAEIIEQLKKAISLLNRWMDNPDEDLLLHHTDTFVREVTQKYEYPCKEFLPGSKKCPIGNKPHCGERSCLLPE
jgi:hypothetical protein